MSERPRDPGRALVRLIARLLAPMAGLILVVLLFTLLTHETGRYLTLGNLRTIAVQTAITGVCGVGMTLVIIGGGIDLSVGSAVALVTVVIALVSSGKFGSRVVETIVKPVAETIVPGLAFDATIAVWIAALAATAAVSVGCYVATRRFWPAALAAAALWIVGWGIFGQMGPIFAVVAGILAGLFCGAVNGWLITASRVVPFIVTLGTMTVFRGTAQLLGKEQSVYAGVLPGWLSRFMSPEPHPEWLLAAPGVWIMLIFGLVAATLLNKMPLGRYIVATGSNEEAARLSGIAIPRVKMWMYGLSGFSCGLAGIMTVSRLKQGDSTTGGGLELDVIAAVVIGGGSLRGGEGSVFGTLIGALIMGFMRNGCSLAGISNSVQQILVGAVIILAVALDEWRHRRQA